MLTDREYQQALEQGKARPARATCPLCWGTGHVSDPDGKSSPLPCYCALSAADARRRIEMRETWLGAVR